MLFPIGRAPNESCSNYCVLRVPALRLVPAILLIFSVSGTSQAQNNAPLTITEAEKLALFAEPGQKALQARAKALRARSVTAGELPQPSLRLGLNNYPFESGGFSTEGMTNAALGFHQAFPAGNSRSIASRQLELSADAMSRSAGARGRDVLTKVRAAWLTLYYWDQARGLVDSSRPYFEDLVTVTRSLYSVGRKSQQDLLRAQLELSRLEDRLIDIERQRAQARSVLSQWIGDDARRPVAATLPNWSHVPPIEKLSTTLVEHPVLTASDAQIAAAEAGVDLANERAKPDWAIDVGYSYREGFLPSGTPRSDFVSDNVTVGLPFFSKRSVDSDLTAALLERSAAKSSRQQTLRELQSELEQQHSLFQDLTRRIELYQTRIIGQSNAHAEASLLAYQSDKGDFAAVMRAYVDDLNTKIDFIRLTVERAQAYAVLDNLGGLER